MDQFEQVQTKYAQLRRQLESNAVTNEQFLEQVADLMCQDADGNWWTVHPDSGVWHIHQDGSWKAAIPPAVVRTVPTPVAPPAAPSPGPRVPSQRWQEPAQRRQTPSWLIPVIAAVAAVAIITAAFVFLLLPQIQNTLNRGQDQETPAVEVTSEVTAPPTVVEATDTPAAKDAPTQVPLGSDASQMKPTWTAVASEGFDVDLGNWDSAATNGTQEYSDSSLLLSTQQGNTLFVSLFGSAEYRDTWVQTTVSDLDGAGGIMVRGKVGDSGYLFGIDSQQQIYLGRLQGSHFAVVNWEPSDKVNAEGEDVLTVFSNGDEHRFFINGWQVGGFRDLTIKQGQIGLWTWALGENVSSISFDNVEVLQGAEATAPIGATATPTGEATETPTGVITSTVTPTPTLETLPTPTVTPGGPLSYEMGYDAFYPGTGKQWVVRFYIDAIGGDGTYTYWVADRQFTSAPFDFEYGCGSSISADLVVVSGDGQTASQKLWINHVSCVSD